MSGFGTGRTRTAVAKGARLEFLYPFTIEKIQVVGIKNWEKLAVDKVGH
jgi:hypothetical protein